jgi:hypothetical protein
LKSSPVDPGRKRDTLKGFFQKKLGAPGFEPRMAFYLLPDPASGSSTEATSDQSASVSSDQSGRRSLKPVPGSPFLEPGQFHPTNTHLFNAKC